ncbi:hypothetical protein KVT40_002580 [Elsinoe batatas]|uniref:TORC1 subunit TCO89 n=1 Tax=Elsinoe batatas TaxID=2601811 RepID=A0A8K0L4E2_9PEZI|nr:hypothetical protein KVT40_002580 [Elsinoe batatas]
MPTDTSASSTSIKRLSGSKEHSQSTAVSHSPGDGHGYAHKSGSHKHQRHVVGHGRLGARNPSVGRNLSKINILAANSDEGSRKDSNATSISPRHPRPGMKRNQSLALMPKNASHTGLRKNHSSGHLVRNSSAKHLSRSHKSEYNRTNSSHSDKKTKRKNSPAPNGRQAAVHFDMGDDDDDDDAEEMEGVDDGWTEESASQSPSTTRDNTRSNTRNNSVILDPNENPYKMDKAQDEKPPDEQDDNPDDAVTHKQGGEVQPPASHDFAPQPATPNLSQARKSSYHDQAAAKPPDAEAIAKRLLQRGNSRQFAAPQISDVSATAYSDTSTADSSAANSKILVPHINTHDTPSMPSPTPVSALKPGSSGSPLVSRFIDPSANGSKDSTPLSPSHIRPTSSSRPTTGSSSKSSPTKRAPEDRSTRDKSDMRRNQSTPSFGLGISNGYDANSGLASGATTPGAPTRSRIEQKMWLARGLSNLEANSQSQSNLAGMVPGGRRGGAAAQQSERVEKELACVRRYRPVIEEGIARVRRVKGGPLAGVDLEGLVPSSASAAGGQGPGRRSVESTRRGKSGATTPAVRSRAVSPISGRTSLGDGEWDGERIEDLEELTLGVRRRMWELMEGEVEDGD